MQLRVYDHSVPAVFPLFLLYISQVQVLLIKIVCSTLSVLFVIFPAAGTLFVVTFLLKQRGAVALISFPVNAVKHGLVC